MSSRPPLRLSVASAEIVGSRERQEDAQLRFELAEFTLLAIADGLGGHADGHVASEIAVQTALRFLRDQLEEGQTPTKRPMVKAFVHAHRQLERLDYRGPRLRPPASTLICAALTHSTGHLKIAACGDSLAWLIRDGDLTDLAPPQGSGSWVAYALGLDIGLHPIGSAVQTNSLFLKPGDRLVLASDGLLTLPREDLMDILATDPDDPALQLVKAIEAIGDPFQDNATAIVVSCQASGQAWQSENNARMAAAQ